MESHTELAHHITSTSYQGKQEADIKAFFSFLDFNDHKCVKVFGDANETFKAYVKLRASIGGQDEAMRRKYVEMLVEHDLTPNDMLDFLALRRSPARDAELSAQVLTNLTQYQCKYTFQD